MMTIPTRRDRQNRRACSTGHPFLIRLFQKQFFSRLNFWQPPPPGLNNRAAANWKLLLAIAEFAGGPWPELARGGGRTSEGIRRRGVMLKMFLRSDL
jgi:hypothetical protein